MKTLTRAIKVLDFVADNPAGVTLQKLKNELDTSKSTLHRTLQTLEQLGLLQSTQNEKHKLYKIGLKVLKYSHAFINNSNFPHVAVDFMEDLMLETGHTVHLAVRNGSEIVYINTVLSQDSSQFFTPIGQKAPIYCTSLGKAILAFTSQPQQERLIASIDFESHTQNTITKIGAFKQELEVVANRGYAIDDSEWQDGVRCVGAPIFDYLNQVVGAISIADSRRRISDQDLSRLGEKVKKVAENISAKLGSQ